MDSQNGEKKLIHYAKLLPINTEDSPDQMAIWEHLATAEGYDRISMNGTS